MEGSAQVVGTAGPAVGVAPHGVSAAVVGPYGGVPKLARDVAQGLGVPGDVHLGPCLGLADRGARLAVTLVDSSQRGRHHPAKPVHARASGRTAPELTVGGAGITVVLVSIVTRLARIELTVAAAHALDLLDTVARAITVGVDAGVRALTDLLLADALSDGAGVVERAGVAVVARLRVQLIGAATLIRAGVGRAGVVIVAGVLVLIARADPARTLVIGRTGLAVVAGILVVCGYTAHSLNTHVVRARVAVLTLHERQTHALSVAALR